MRKWPDADVAISKHFSYTLAGRSTSSFILTDFVMRLHENLTMLNSNMHEMNVRLTLF